MLLGRRRPEQEEKIELKMTSMVDVVFLLLIFFIVTLKIPQEEAMIETQLPRTELEGEKVTEEQKEAAEFEDIMLSLRKEQGRVETYVNEQPVPTLTLLIQKLRTLHDLNPDGRVVIDCADRVPYQELIRAINAVHMAELKISFANL